MQASRLQTRSVQICVAVHRPEAGPAGIGVAAAGSPRDQLSGIREQAVGEPDVLFLRAILRALQLGRRLKAENVSILCPDQRAVRIVNREETLEPGSPLAPLYIRIKAQMYSFRDAEVLAVPQSRVEAARRLAMAASRNAHSKTEVQPELFELPSRS